MDLKEFISATISAIAEATSELQVKFANDGILVNPPAAQSGADVYQPGSPNYTMRRVQRVVFDVAVTASNEAVGGGSAGIKVWSIEVGAKQEKTSMQEKVSRVQFEIPMTFKPSVHEATNLAVKTAKDAKLAQPIPKRQNLGDGLR